MHFVGLKWLQRCKVPEFGCPDIPREDAVFSLDLDPVALGI